MSETEWSRSDGIVNNNVIIIDLSITSGKP